MQISVNLPIIIDFPDYHDIDHVKSYMKQVIKGLKARELEFRDGCYWGIFYLKKDEKYKQLVKEHKKLAKEYEREFYK